MKNTATLLAVTGCGLITSIMTAILLAVISNLTTLDIFSYSFWVVIPAGAMGCGMLVASGYYFGSLYFHYKPTKSLFFNIVIFTAFTQILIYYTQYSTLVLDDGTKASQIISFIQYMQISLTKAHYYMTRSHIDTGEIGNAGYGLAVIQFIGFMFGSICILVKLASLPTCQGCNKYYRLLASKDKKYSSFDSFAKYYDEIFTQLDNSEKFSQMLTEENPEKIKSEKGTILLKESLYGCPQCKSQLIGNTVSVYNGSDWKEVDDLKRQASLSADMNMLKEFGISFT